MTIFGFLLFATAIALGAVCYSFEKLSWLNRFFLASIVGMICGRVLAYLLGVGNYVHIVMLTTRGVTGFGLSIWLAYRYPFDGKGWGERVPSNK
jgi:hypothetical protein